jgi:hypothetical protein
MLYSERNQYLIIPIALRSSYMKIKQIVAASLLIIPMAAASLSAKPASAESIVTSQNHFEKTVNANSHNSYRYGNRHRYGHFHRYRVWIPGCWQFDRYGRRYWVPGRYEYRYRTF